MHPRLVVKQAMRRHLGDEGQLCCTDLETVFVPARRLRKAADDLEVKDLRVWELRDVLRRALCRRPDAALDLVVDVLGLQEVGVVLARAPLADAPGAPLVETVEAGAAVGAVQAAMASALADGVLGSEEAAEVAKVVRLAERELLQVGELCRQAQDEQLEFTVCGAVR